MTPTTPDIEFRKPEPADLGTLYKQKNDPEVKRLLGGFSHPMAERDLEDWLEWHRKQTNEVLWAIVATSTGRCLGHVGLYQIDPIVRTADLGIMIGAKEAWGKGIGRAAVLHSIRYGFDVMNLNRVSLTVLATNVRAIRLYTRLGFALEGTLRQAQYRDGEYVDVLAMGLLRAEFTDE